MIPWVHSYAEAVIALIAIAGVLLMFERRLARVETRVELLLRYFQIGDDHD